MSEFWKLYLRRNWLLIAALVVAWVILLVSRASGGTPHKVYPNFATVELTPIPTDPPGPTPTPKPGVTVVSAELPTGYHLEVDCAPQGCSIDYSTQTWKIWGPGTIRVVKE